MVESSTDLAREFRRKPVRMFRELALDIRELARLERLNQLVALLVSDRNHTAAVGQSHAGC